jgi:hypothetical protein
MTLLRDYKQRRGREGQPARRLLREAQALRAAWADFLSAAEATGKIVPLHQR